MARTSSGVDAKLVKKLYRNILRTTKNWPYYEDRTNYLQQGLQSTVRTLFRAHANETDPKKVERLVSYGLLEHGSMKRILSGVYFGQFKSEVSAKRAVPPEVLQAKTLLSNTVQQKMSKNKWGFWDRIMLSYKVYTRGQ